MPQKFSADIETVVKRAREMLGARLVTWYEDGKKSGDPKDEI
jgi:hypothetical protein